MSGGRSEKSRDNEEDVLFPKDERLEARDKPGVIGGVLIMLWSYLEWLCSSVCYEMWWSKLWQQKMLGAQDLRERRDFNL